MIYFESLDWIKWMVDIWCQTKFDTMVLFNHVSIHMYNKNSLVTKLN